ncbi:MAG: redoxin domain-containing protein [SAR324 cluster bacterium]|nr:redoxin domain-containing protein [SAR324 cluster bacterium]
MAYCKIAVISPDPPKVQEAFRAGLGADFPFLSDERLELTDALGIRETTDTRHGPLPVPYTFALLPGLTIHRIFNGWYMAGRPTPEELRQTLRQLLRATHRDFDFPGE